MTEMYPVTRGRCQMGHCLGFIFSIEAEAVEMIPINVKGWVAVHRLGRDGNKCTRRYVCTVGQRVRLLRATVNRAT
jgi:hypothetical protein